ncbi:MAG: hypothetical protein NT169_18360 [Chloroflexi bacterium]|nr:hypothetical protein [Chloroflexota bacterium]
MKKKTFDREAIRQARAEDAAYLDSTDTSAEMAQETHWLKFEWAPREDRCDRCGAKMQPFPIDLPLSGGRVVLRQVARYVCQTPGCGQTRLVPAVAALAGEIESLVKRVLPTGAATPIASPWPHAAQMREGGSEYETGAPGQP